MRFTLSSSALSGRLQNLSKVISAKTSLTILQSFLFEVKDNVLTIVASDSENVMQTQLNLDESDGNGVVAFPSRTVMDAVKELPEQPLTFDVNLETFETLVNYQNGVYRFTAQSAEAYPQTTALPDGARSFIIDAGSLIDNIARTIFATDNNEIRPAMNGIYFDLLTDNLSFVASDGHKLVRCRNYSITSETPASFILPKKPATLLRNVLDRNGGDVTVRFNDNTAEFTFADGKLTCRLIEGVFPNYNAAIPKDNTNELTIDRKALLSAIRRVLPFASMSSQLVRFKLKDGALEISSEDLDFATSADERVICEFNGVPMQIGFRGDFFTEILNAIDTDEVKILLGDPSRAGIVLPATQPEGEDVLMLIMPLLLND